MIFEKPRTKPPTYWYTIYDRDTDRFLAQGTEKHCADALGIKRQTLYVYTLRQDKKDWPQRYVIYREPYKDIVDEEMEMLEWME